MTRAAIANNRLRITNRGARTTNHEPRTTYVNQPLGSLKSPSYRYAASVLNGVLLFSCFPRFNLHPMVWVAYLPLLIAVVSELRLGRAYLLGALAGVVFLVGSIYWFVGVMESYGHVQPVLAWAALAPFLIVFSSFWGAFGFVEAWVARRSIPRALVLGPFLWVALELARTYYFVTGFPWNLLGYAVQATGLRQLASVTAVYGLSFLAVASSALLAGVWLAPGRRTATIAVSWFALLVIVNWVMAFSVKQQAPAVSTTYLVQPDVPLNDKVQETWAPWRNAAELNRLVYLSRQTICKGLPSESTALGPDCSNQRLASPDPRPLVVWSENPAPFYFGRDPVFTAAMQGMARAAHAYVLFNTVIFAGRDNALPQNSALVLDPDGRQVLQYDKIHLVPFGEYVPSWLQGLVGKITSEVGDYLPGTHYQAAQTPDGSIGVFICYEDIFPQLVRKLVPPGPGVLVNISNDSWYADSSAAYQHLEMARLRAIENRRFLLRSTNDGITALIDPYGQIVQRLPRYQQSVLVGHFSYISQRTFYTRWGDVFAWLCVAVAGAVVGYTVVSSRQ